MTGLAFALLLAAFLLHWIVWRIKIPRRQSASLLLIFLGIVPLGLAAMLHSPLADLVGPLKFWACAQIALFQVAMSLAYVVAYSALEERSPSMTLLLFVAGAGPEGRTEEELEGVLRAKSPVERRLDAMVRDEMIVEADGTYRLTAKGKLWHDILSCWLRLLKMDKGG